MKKLIFLILVLSISSICKAQTDENDSIIETSDGIEKDLESASTIKSYAPKQSIFLKNGKTRLTHGFRMGILLGKDDIMSPNFSSKSSDDFSEDVKEKTEQGTTYGLDLAYRLTFTPGKLDKEKQTFQVNPMGFGYSFGINISGDFQQNYGFSCDVLASAGIELGNSKFGFGIDGLVGTGNNVGFELGFHPDPELCYIDKQSKLAFKYGAQIWLKIPSFFGGFVAPQQVGNRGDMRLFVRYIMNSATKEETVEGFIIAKMFTTEALQVGISFSF